MTRILFKFLNGPALILLTFIAVAIQSSFFTFWILPYLQPDIVLLVVIWCALRRSFLEGGILTLILGNLTEIHSASPRGLFMISYMAIYFLIRMAARILVIPDLRSYALLTLFASLAVKIFSFTIIYMLGLSLGQWNHNLLFVVPGALMNGFLAQWVFGWLHRFDHRTFKTIRDNRLDNDALDLDYESRDGNDEFQMHISEI